jgi:hypothetical protein
MAFLADSDDRSEWLLVVPFAALLATILSLQGPPAGRERAELRDMAVCERQTFPPMNVFFLLH